MRPFTIAFLFYQVIESDKERALSEKEHLDTARTFSEAGNKVTELRTKLKSAISKSRYSGVLEPICVTETDGFSK